MAYKDKKQALYAVVSRRLTALEKGGDRGELANIRRYGFDGKAYENYPDELGKPIEGSWETKAIDTAITLYAKTARGNNTNVRGKNSLGKACKMLNSQSALGYLRSAENAYSFKDTVYYLNRLLDMLRTRGKNSLGKACKMLNSQSALGYLRSAENAYSFKDTVYYLNRLLDMLRTQKNAGSLDYGQLACDLYDMRTPEGKQRVFRRWSMDYYYFTTEKKTQEKENN